MLLGGNTDPAKIALFDFMLEYDEQKQIEAFNKILNLLGIGTELSKNGDGHYIWKHCSYIDQYRAEKLFDEITRCLTPEKIHELLNQEKTFDLITQYRKVIDETTRKMEIMSECDLSSTTR